MHGHREYIRRFDLYRLLSLFQTISVYVSSKSTLELVKTQSLAMKFVKCGRYSLVKFANHAHFVPYTCRNSYQIWAESGRNYRIPIQMRCTNFASFFRSIISAFYDISKLNFTVLPILVCSIQLW